MTVARQILNYAPPADMVGLQGTLMREMQHSVEALTPLVLCVFPRSKLWDLYSRLPSLAFDVTWLAVREEQLIDEHLVSLGRRTALERTAFLLLHLFLRAEEAGLVKDASIQFTFTQQHVADTLGMSLVHTNKTLKWLFFDKGGSLERPRIRGSRSQGSREDCRQQRQPAHATSLHLRWRSMPWCDIGSE